MADQKPAAKPAAAKAASPAPVIKAERPATEKKVEGADQANKGEAAAPGLVTYHVLRRHDGEGSNEYDTADAIARGGASAAHRQSTRDMRPDDAKHLVELGVLSDKPPAKGKGQSRATMVGLGREQG